MDTGKLQAVVEGKKITARGVLRPEEAFFQDHFPDFPVLPGVLMIEIMRAAAEKFFQQQHPRRNYRLMEVTNVRYSNFLKPGEAWEARVEILAGDDRSSDWKGQLLKESRPICAAKFKLEVKSH